MRASPPPGYSVLPSSNHISIALRSYDRPSPATTCAQAGYSSGSCQAGVTDCKFLHGSTAARSSCVALWLVKPDVEHWQTGESPLSPRSTTFTHSSQHFREQEQDTQKHGLACLRKQAGPDLKPGAEAHERAATYRAPAPQVYRSVHSCRLGLDRVAACSNAGLRMAIAVDGYTSITKSQEHGHGSTNPASMRHRGQGSHAQLVCALDVPMMVLTGSS